MNIVIVEDDDNIRVALEILLTATHNVTSFRSGMDMLLNGFELPDLFLIDWRLRGMSGLDICRRLKNDPITSSIPVVIMSAALHLEEEARHVGADGVIQKPMSKMQLEHVFRQVAGTSI